MVKKKSAERWNHIIFHGNGRTTTEFLCCKLKQAPVEKEQIDTDEKKAVA